MITTNIQTKLRRIEELTPHEFDMVYSLMRVGDWPDSEISRAYRLSVDDVHKIFDNYPQLREAILRNPPRDILPQTPEEELTTKKPRKRRCDAVYATAKERQAAYKARLQEKRLASLEQPSPANETDPPGPDVEELPASFCQDPVTETSPENAETQYSTCDSSPAEGSDISESVPLPVTSEACSEREELRVIEEKP
jgi:hypothetical protein